MYAVECAFGAFITISNRSSRCSLWLEFCYFHSVCVYFSIWICCACQRTNLNAGICESIDNTSTGHSTALVIFHYLISIYIILQHYTNQDDDDENHAQFLLLLLRLQIIRRRFSLLCCTRASLLPILLLLRLRTRVRGQRRWTTTWCQVKAADCTRRWGGGGGGGRSRVSIRIIGRSSRRGCCDRWSLSRSVSDVTDQQFINRSDRLCSFVLFLVLLFLNKARPCVSRCVVCGRWMVVVSVLQSSLLNRWGSPPAEKKHKTKKESSATSFECCCESPCQWCCCCCCPSCGHTQFQEDQN